MSRIIMAIVAIGSILQTDLVTAQGGTTAAAVQNQIVANEKVIIDAIVKNDPKTFHSHVVSDSLMLGGEGVMKVADFDKMMGQMKADCKIAKWGLTDSTFYWLNDSSVVHVYKTSIDGTCQGQRLPAVWSSTVWVNKGGKWLGGFHQESPVTPPPSAGKN
jgi:hypothetical protein